MVSSQQIRRAAYTTTTYSSALWALYKAGEITYKRLQYALGLSPKKQKTFLGRYSKSGIKPKELMSLKKQVRNINKILKHDLSSATYRQRDTSVEGVSANTKAYLDVVGLDTTIIEAALTNLRYWNEATSAYTTASPTTTASNEMMISSVYSKCVIRNNYQVPCDVEFYCLVPASDTSNTPSTAYITGLADQNNPSATSPLMYITDSDYFNSLWKIKSSVKRRLEPGREASLSYAAKAFTYDPSLVDSHNFAYQAKHRAHSYLIRVTGVISHDTTANEQGMGQAAVDVFRDITVKVSYDSGGPSLNDFKVVDNSNSFTNNATLSNKPIADNQIYSVL